ncbi:MAG TPA: hypothetical protein VK158_05805 [Acidobacteriota bacterium]|nr:hypothetical protein [Acidobacteriota bacterium]
MKPHWQKKIILVAALVLMCLSLLMPIIQRASSNNVMIPLEQSFHTLQIVSDADSQYWESNTPYIWLLRAWTMWSTPIVLQILLGVISFIFIWLLLGSTMDNLELSIFLGTCIISPVFIISHISLTPYAFITCLLLAALWISQTSWWLVGLGLFFIVGLEHVAVAAVALLGHLILHKYDLNYIPKQLGTLVICIAGTIRLVDAFRNDISQIIPHYSTIVEFGAFIGFPLLYFILFCIGFFITWNRGEKSTHIFALIVITLSWFYPQLLLISNIILCYFATKSIAKTVHEKWELPSLKVLVIVCLLIAGLVTYTLYADRLTQAPPTTNQKNSLLFLMSQSEQDSIVWSHPKNTYLIEAIASRQSFTPAIPTKQDWLTFNSIANETRLTAALSNLAEHNISYLYLDEQMTTGLVWSVQDEGFLLLLNNPRAFTKLYDEHGTQIYRVNYENVEEELNKVTTK